MQAYTEILILIITLGMSMLLQYLVIDISNKKGIFLDNIAKIQQVHHYALPRIGGLGIFLSSLFMGYYAPLGMLIMIASIPAFFAGFLEDYSDSVSPIQRLTIMLLAPFIACFIIPDSNLIYFDQFELAPYIGIAATLFLTTTLINGINFIDGQNGLAASASIVILSGLAYIAYLINDTALLYISLTAVAATLGFLIFNFPKAKIFLGDGGAYFLGFIIAIMSIYLTQHHHFQVSILSIVALCIMPLCEVAFSVVRKLCFDKISPLQSDKYHLHQLIFRNIGMQNQALPTLIILPLIIINTAFVTYHYNQPVYLMISIAVFIMVYTLGYTLLRVADVKRRIKNMNKSSH